MRFQRVKNCPAAGWLLLSLLVALISPRQALAQATSEPATRAVVDTPELIEARRALAEIPADVQGDTLAGQKRAALQKKVTLLEEAAGLAEQKKLQAADNAARGERLAALKKEFQAINAAAASTQATTQPTREGFETLKTQVTQKRDRVAQLKEGMNQRTRRNEELPGLIARAKGRVEAAEKQVAELTSQAANAVEGEGKKVLELQLADARLDAANAANLVGVLEAEQSVSGGPASLGRMEVSLAERQLEVMEQELAAYTASMGKLLADETRKQQDEAQRQKQEAAAATDPVERFLAEWKSKIAIVSQDKSAVEAFVLSTKQDLIEQQKRTTIDQEEQANLEELLKRTGGAVKASDRIKRLLDTLRLRRLTLQRLIHSGLDEKVDDFRAKRFEIEDALFSLNDKWNAERDHALAGQPADARTTGRTRAVLNQYRGVLQDEKELLTDAISAGERLQGIYLERLDRLDALERTIRAKVFWLRDGKPLGPEAVRPLWGEIGALAAWGSEVFSAGALDRIRQRIDGPLALIFGLLLFPVLPVGLLYLRRKLRGLVLERNQRALTEGASQGSRLLALLFAVISAALLPVYILLAGKFVGSMGLPATIGPVLSGALQQVACFLFFWFITRSVLRPGGIAQSQFGLNKDASLCLSRWVRVALVGYILLLVPSGLLAGAPFEFSAGPRILYTLFEMVAGLSIMMVIRGGSPFVQKGIAPAATSMFGRHWWVISFGVGTLLLAIFLLDVMGYRYASASMARSFILSLASVALMLSIYAVLIKGLQRMPWSRRAVAAPGEKAATRWQVQIQVRRIVRGLFALIAVVLVATFWGIDKQAFRILADVRLMSVGAGDTLDYLTAADLVRGILFATATFWVLWALPGIYEIAVFPRLKLDQGLKYAILTISRYGVFVAGFMLTLSAVHLDLSRLGWLMAAVGVGLGFGLQEIVSNFVSGIILLVERPVQVGDQVTIGTTEGRVKRINIRATTVVNGDRQEVIVPNRNFITSQVTNWTRGDTINRLTVTIGVAYGSDVSRVTDLLMQAAGETTHALKDPKPSVIFARHGESALEFEVRVLVASPDFMLGARDQLNKSINRVLKENDIEIPFPQRDLHIRSSSVGGKEEALFDSSQGNGK